MKLGSLFDGSGGFPLAGALCGIEPVWASEIEPYPIAVTRERFPSMKHHGDISKINGAEVEPVDIITFGSPCQDLSVAGKRAGLKHEANGDEETTRSGLFMEAVRIIKEMRDATNGEYPSFALWENVPGAFSSNKGEDFRVVCEELIKIVEPSAAMPAVPKAGWAYADSYVGDGWSLAYRVFDAQYWGVPQRRRRIHLVVDFRGERARKVLFEREGVRGYFEAGGKTRKTAPTDAEGSAGADDRDGENAGVIGFDAYQHHGYRQNKVCGTLTAGQNDSIRGDTPLIVEESLPYTLKIRSGCEGGGKGALIQKDKSATLATNNDQILFQPKSIREENWEEGHIKNALRAGESKCSHVIVEQYLFENHSQDTRYKGPLDVCPMLPAQLGTGGNNTPFVVKQARDFKEPQAVAYYGDGSQTAGTLTANNAGGNQRMPDKENFNCVIEQDAVYGVDVRNGNESKELYPTLQAKPNGGQSLNVSSCVRYNYVVRRLTPTECARLQGFDIIAYWWGHISQKDTLTDEEYRFWLDVRNTHAAINDKPVKKHTVKQMLTWYNKLHTDSAEYKMWGNGIALPPALYCMQGIVEACL